MNILGVIPARYASTRFPGKPLALINGISMIERVYKQTLKANTLNKVVVATDNNLIYNHVVDFGGEAVMTDTNIKNGTERCAQALSYLEKQNLKFDIIINIQGDEPFINPQSINILSNTFLDKNVEIATLIKEITSEDELFNPNVMKVVRDINNYALYFSRSPIPYVRDTEKNNWLDTYKFMKHIGIYAFKKEVLNNVTKLPTSTLETAESLEQLRWLENAYKIKTSITNYESFSIDTPEDLKKIEKLFP